VNVTFLSIHPFFAAPSGTDEHMRWLADRLVERGHRAAFHVVAMRGTPAEQALLRLRRLQDERGWVFGHPVGWQLVPPPERFPPILLKGVVERALRQLGTQYVVIPSGDAILGQICLQLGYRTLVFGDHEGWLSALTDPVFRANLDGLELAVCSAAVAHVAEAELGARPWLLVPGVDPRRVVGRVRTFEERLALPIGMINAARRKGASAFADVAASLPMLRFVATPGTAAEIPVPMPANVNEANPRNAMRAFYGSLQMLLVPSLWFEPWSRLVTEAQLNGIPVLGTDRGGLIEVLSETPIPVRQWALEPWKDPIVTSSVARGLADRIAQLREPDVYRDAVERGMAKALAVQDAAIASVDRLEAVITAG